MLSKGILRQYYAAFSCYFCCMMCGVGFAWFTPIMIQTLRGDYGYDISYSDLSWMVAIIEIGELITPIPAGHYANSIGRKTWLTSTFYMVILSWVLTVMTRSVPVLFIIRLLQGFAIGIILTIGPIYAAEISSPEIRGQLCGHLQTMWYMGILYANCIGPFVPYDAYAYLSSIPAFLFLALFYFIPESPYYLLITGREKEAEESLKWFRGDADIKVELNEIKNSIEKETSTHSGWLEIISTEKSRRSLYVLCAGCFIKYYGGTSTVVNFSTKTLAESRNNVIGPEYVTILLVAILVVMTGLSAWVTDRIGRKPLIVISSFLLGLVSLVIAVYYFLERETNIDVSEYQYVLYISLVAYCLAASMGLAPALFAIQAECFPANTRGAAGAIATCLSTSLVFVSLKQYQVIDEDVGVYMNFIIYAVACFSGIIIVLIYMKETANKSLAQIQEHKI